MFVPLTKALMILADKSAYIDAAGKKRIRPVTVQELKTMTHRSKAAAAKTVLKEVAN